VINLKPLPFDEAMRFFTDKGLRLSPDSYRDVWGAEHVASFTVARVTALDVLEDVRAAAQAALDSGMSLDAFKRDLIPLLERKGWFSPSGVDAIITLPDGSIRKRLTPWRLDTIYRTNLQSAYQAGRYRQSLENAPYRPWWMYDAVNDARTRPSHAAMDGKVYRFDHPVWDRWYPPNGYNCRCTVRTLSDRNMADRGLSESVRPPLAPPDEGFDHNPGLVKWKPDLSRYTPQARKIITGANLSVPTNTTQLGEWLGRARDGLKNTGIATSAAPITIKPETRFGMNGSADYQSGEIFLKSDWLRSVNAALAAGKVETAEQMNAFKTLVHEFGHQLGHPLRFPEYRMHDGYRTLAQTINDVWARHKTPNYLGAFGLSYPQSEAARLVLEHPTGYQLFVERFRSILRAAGIDQAGEIALVSRLNLAVDASQYSDEMWRALKQAVPSLQARDHFGKVLYKKRKYDWLMDELRRLKNQ
jgi:SPP1 gp7 family putative phage head morphogenesis protein